MIANNVLPGVVDLRGLTVWNPMAWAIAIGRKPIENRTQRPYAGVTHIAIHAGKWHEPHRKQMLDAGLFDVVPRRDQAQAGIVAVVRLMGYITSPHDELFEEHPSARVWFSGPVGWVLGHVRPLDEPIPYKGAQGLWVLPGELRERLLPLCV